MPVDHKRINGPEESYPYELFTRKKHTELKNVDIKGEQNKLCLRSGVISQAKGSCYVEFGQTKVIVTTFDPREIPNKPEYGLKGEVSCEFKFAPFSCKKRKLHQQNNEEKLFSTMMKKALESAVCLHELPNFQVDVYALVLQNDGSALSSAIIGAGVALAEAGVPMYDVITSATLGITKEGFFLESQLFEKGNSEDRQRYEYESTDYGMMTISKLHTHQQICQFFQTGYISPEKVKDCLQTLSKSCDNIVPVVKKCLLKGIISNIKS